MKTVLHIMVDTETTGLTSNEGRIWQLGAVATLQNILPSDYSKFSIQEERFLFTVNPASIIGLGLFNRDTIEWQRTSNLVEWESAYESSNTYDDFLHDGLKQFQSWIDGILEESYITEPVKFWAQGTDFDFGFLNQAYREAAMNPPYKYNQLHDLRTMRNMLGHLINEPKSTVAHNALKDAEWQTDVLLQILDVIYN